MRDLKRGTNNKTEVKFLQAWLNQFDDANLSVDGSFGKKSETAVKNFQKKNGLPETGVACQKTLNKMGFRTAANKGIVILEIPFSRIGQANVLLENGKASSCQKFAAKGYDIVWNGAHFERSTHKVVQLVAISGRVIQWGMGYCGIAYPNAFSKAYGENVNQIVNKLYDMQGGAPVMISNYARDNEAIKAFSRSIWNAKTKRNCTGVTENSLILMFSLAGLTLEEMTTEGLHQKVKFLQANDGGGSQSLYMGGAPVITTDGRGIPAAVGLKVR